MKTRREKRQDPKVDQGAFIQEFRHKKKFQSMIVQQFFLFQLTVTTGNALFNMSNIFSESRTV